jgi:hypothetical protein
MKDNLMGWLYHNDKLRHQTPVQYITKEFTCEGPTGRATVLAAAVVGNTIYAAIRNEDAGGGSPYVFAAVILFENNERNGFGYKIMDETMGPYQADCPDRIMRLLSSIEDLPSAGYAAKWRANVEAARARRRALNATRQRLTPGCVVRLTHPAVFKSWCIETDTFKLLEFRKRTPIFAPVSHPWKRCRLRKSSLLGATIET